MGEATARARQEGFESMHLTVHPSNDRAVRFYRSIGWTPVDDSGGEWSGRMTFSLDADR